MIVLNVLEAYEKQLQEQKLFEDLTKCLDRTIKENEKYAGYIDRQNSIELYLKEKRNSKLINIKKQFDEIRYEKPKYYNVKHIEKLNSEEYVFYNNPVVSGLRKSSTTKTEYEEKDGIQYNKVTGQQRTQESIDHSLFNSLNRTKQKIYDYALANDFTNGYFLTITFNQEYVDRYNYAECYKHIKNLVRNIRRNNPDIKYIFVPERHRDGAWHFHGLIVNCENLILIDSGKTVNKKKVYNINLQTYKYGFTTATKIEDTNKVSSYITKYITKELIESTKGQHRYLFSKNLDVPVVSTEWVIDQDDIELKKMLIERSERFEQKKVLGDAETPNKIEYYRLRKK